MENVNESAPKTTANNANETGYYLTMTLGIAVGMTGVILRFVSDWQHMDLIANFIFIVGTIISLKAVFGILK